MKQPQLKLFSHGGARQGAGRPKLAGAGVPHLPREMLAARYPLHVTLKVLPGIPDLRTPRLLPVLESAFAEGCRRFGFRLVHYSIQSNHIHLIAEAQERVALARGMQGLGIRTARRLNKALGRSGKVFTDRYHARVLKTPKEVRRVLNYVLNNAMLHARKVGGTAPTYVDPYSSGRFFDGWTTTPRSAASNDERAAVAEPRSWLLRVGWRRHGLITAGAW